MLRYSSAQVSVHIHLPFLCTAPLPLPLSQSMYNSLLETPHSKLTVYRCIWTEVDNVHSTKPNPVLMECIILFFSTSESASVLPSRPQPHWQLWTAWVSVKPLLWCPFLSLWRAQLVPGASCNNVCAIWWIICNFCIPLKWRMLRMSGTDVH
jgi:hypothetical protein